MTESSQEALPAKWPVADCFPNDTARPLIYSLSLHVALPIWLESKSIVMAASMELGEPMALSLNVLFVNVGLLRSMRIPMVLELHTTLLVRLTFPLFTQISPTLLRPP